MESAARFGPYPALVVDGDKLSYRELSDQARAIATAILNFEQDRFPLTALLAHRSVTAYAGVLGILASGRGYVPLNPKFPLERTRSMLHLAGCTTLVVGRESVSQLPKLLGGLERPLTVILPDVSSQVDLSAGRSDHRLIFRNQIPAGCGFPFPTELEADAIAYLLFTSGSTGVPKGVPIYHRNVRSYIEYVCDRYEVTELDRFSQEFDLTFDLSVHDMFVCWERGACLYCVPEKSVMAPAKFIRENELTMWFSVPSVIGLLSRMRLLPTNCFPKLRCSLFCGEPLTAMYADLWMRATPNSVLENLYGPTETTIAISSYRWDAARSPKECINGIVPIGWPFTGQTARLIGDDHQTMPPGETGELCLSGSQVTTGYWNNPEKTREQFIQLAETGKTLWYRTGDLVRRDERSCLYYLGRMDQQIKIRGYRVELQEIEAILRKVCNTDQVVCVPWPVHNGTVDGVVAIISGEKFLDPDGVLNRCSELLPPYMVPSRIYSVEHLPLNANGKIDRSKLADLIEGMQA
ncbi:MAG: amino acid adenylation domain-containing protein [Candidatus Acidiferrales bacterium]